jgi:hypothetical protein
MHAPPGSGRFYLDSLVMAMLRATPGKVRAFRAIAHHLHERLPAKEWTEAFGVGLQDTPPGSALLALAARAEGITPDHWQTERVASRNLVVSWSVRGAPFAHLIEDHDRFSVAARPTGEQAWHTLLGWSRSTPDEVGMAAAEAATGVAAEVELALEDGPLTKAELSGALSTVLPTKLLPWCRACKVHHVPEQLLRTAGLFGGFVFGEDAGDRFTLVRTDQWLTLNPSPDEWVWPQPTGRAARRQRLDLLHRYLSAYGPADAAMFASWLGVSVSEGAHRLAEAESAGHLVPVAADGDERSRGWVYVEDEEDFRAVRPADVRGVRLVPPGDPFLQQRDRGTLIADRARQKEVWTALGGPGVVVIDGGAAGTWRARKKGSTLTLTVKPFERLRPRDVRGIEAEAEVVAVARGTDLAGVAVAG